MTTEPGTTQPDPDPPVVFDAAAIERARRDAAKAKDAEIAGVLGMSPAEARKLLDAVKAADEAAKTQAERDREAHAERERALAAREAEVAARALQADVRVALLSAGLNPARLDRAARMVDATDADQIGDAVAALKAEMPELFGAPAAPKAPASTPTARTHKAPAAGTSWDAGKQEARRRFGAPTP